MHVYRNWKLGDSRELRNGLGSGRNNDNGIWYFINVYETDKWLARETDEKGRGERLYVIDLLQVLVGVYHIWPHKASLVGREKREIGEKGKGICKKRHWSSVYFCVTTSF